MNQAGSLAILCLLFLSAGLSAGAAESVVGLPLTQVLDEAIRDGAKVVYSSEWVSPALKVLREPEATDPIKRLREVLAAHGLTLQSDVAGIWVVVPAARGAQAADSVSDQAPLPALESNATLTEVLVSSSRYTLLAPSTSPAHHLSAADIQTQPALLDDALRAIRRFPGTAGSAYSSKTHVRGGDNDENLIVLDGVPLTEPFRLQGLPADLSLIDPAMIEKIDFYSGVFPVEYGGRMSSVTHLRSRRASDPFGGRVGVGFVSASAVLEGTFPRDDSSWLVSLRRGMLDLIAEAMEPGTGRPGMMDAFVTARLRATDRTMLSFGALSAADDIDLKEIDGSEATLAKSKRVQLWAGFDSTWGAGQVLTRLAYNSSDHKRFAAVEDDESVAGELTDIRSVRSVALSQDGQLPLRDLALRWGWLAEDMSVEYAYKKSTVFAPQVLALFGSSPLNDFAIEADLGGRTLATYASAKWSPGDAFALDAGARWERHDYDNAQHAQRIDPRVSFLYRINPRSRGRLAWGRLTQFASGLELPIERGSLSYDEPARASVWILGWDYELSPDRALRIELYDKRIKDPWARIESLLNPLVLVPELRPDQVLIAPERAHTRGVDIHLFGKLYGPWHGWLSYSGSRAQEELASGWTSRSWDQRHAVGLGVTTDRWGWNFTAALTAHSGWPTTRVDVAPSGKISLGRRNAERLPWFTTLDLKAQRSFPLRYGALRIGAELTNATNHSNACCAVLELADDESATGLAEVHRKTWLPLLPFLNIAWEF